MKQYHEQLLEVLQHGELSTDRTGTGTLSLFGMQARYDLREGFPLVTTKKVNFGAVVKELLWFLRGETNIKTLGSKIWDEWADEEGELGRIYGQQWRNWDGMNTEFAGVDQIRQAAQLLKTDPDSRRNIVTAWNPGELHLMALPPCHMMFQLRRYGEFVDLQLYQRSADMALGVPFNIASYALLLSLFAAGAELTPRFFIHTIGDAHIYLNHVNGLKEQLARFAFPLPQLELCAKPSLTSLGGGITGDQIRLVDYHHHPAIKFEVAV